MYNGEIELPDNQGYLLEIPGIMEYSIQDLKKITNYPEELKSIADMTNSIDSEIKTLGYELLNVLKDE